MPIKFTPERSRPHRSIRGFTEGIEDEEDYINFRRQSKLENFDPGSLLPEGNPEDWATEGDYLYNIFDSIDSAWGDTGLPGPNERWGPDQNHPATTGTILNTGTKSGIFSGLASEGVVGGVNALRRAAGQKGVKPHNAYKKVLSKMIPYYLDYISQHNLSQEQLQQLKDQIDYEYHLRTKTDKGFGDAGRERLRQAILNADPSNKRDRDLYLIKQEAERLGVDPLDLVDDGWLSTNPSAF